MSSTSQNIDDRLSMLPEEILSHILSLMPTKFAVRTSILSKRWRYTWMFVTNLDFEYIGRHPSDENFVTRPVDGNEKDFTKFVDRVLKFYKTSHAKLFRLHVSSCQVSWSSISNWIDNAVRLNVRELDIGVAHPQLPLSVFTCKTLTNLRLSSSACDNVVREFPSQIHLPCLKTLDIADYYNSLSDALKLIRGCPVLESLSLELSCKDDEEFTFNISTLKRLKLGCSSVTKCYNTKLVLHVPNLEYLFVGGILCSFFVMEDVSSLVGAAIACWLCTYNCISFDLLNQITRVQTLAIENFAFTSPLPIFPNMKQLELNGLWECGQITQFLESCPELKMLCIDFVYWRDFKAEEESKLIPACMLTNLTTIKFLECDGGASDIEFLEYMLGNAKVLKTVTVFALEDVLVKENPFCAQVLEFPRASPHCEIHFQESKYYDSDEELY